MSRVYLYHIEEDYWEVPRKVRPYGAEGEEEKDEEADEVEPHAFAASA